MPRLGVMGWPVGHSRSPAMFAAAFAACGMDGALDHEPGRPGSWSYHLLPVPPELFGETLRALPGTGFKGVNVTIPHKEAGLALADRASEAAQAIGSANTLTFEPDGTIHAENTDAPGFLAALARDPAGARAVVLGAGGSARAVVWALVQAGASEVAVWNRTAERAVALARELGARAVASVPPDADLLINCTSVGLGAASASWAGSTTLDGAPALPVALERLAGYGCVVDLVYGEQDTPLLAAAKEQGVATVDGRELLVRQGALSFELWTGHPGPLEAMRAAVGAPRPAHGR